MWYVPKYFELSHIVIRLDPQGYKKNFMLCSSTQHKISTAHKN